MSELNLIRTWSWPIASSPSRLLTWKENTAPAMQLIPRLYQLTSYPLHPVRYRYAHKSLGSPHCRCFSHRVFDLGCSTKSSPGSTVECFGGAPKSIWKSAYSGERILREISFTWHRLFLDFTRLR